MKDVLLIKYGEISLRGKNRYLYENNIIKTIQNNLQSFEGVIIKKEQSRLLIEDETGQGCDRYIPQLQPIAGIWAICCCIKTEDQDIDSLCQAALQYMQQNAPAGEFSFKVETRRCDKRYPLQSMEVSAIVGGYLLRHMERASVNVREPQVVLNIELRNDAYIYSRMVKGIGGLPYGSSGKGLLLLSGGIDSPVAGYMMAKRGVEIVAVYFHSPPHTSERAKDKVFDLARRLAVYTGRIKLYVVPFTATQIYLYENVKQEKLTIFLKRAMLKISDMIAQAEKCHCLITGDSVGQVASQTMQSIVAVHSATESLVMRPLAGMDKQEIVDLAVTIETYDISIRPYEDCCTLFVAAHPETKPKASVIEKLENRLTGLSALLERAAAEAEIVVLTPHD